jgi:predicted ester cyclase
MGEVIFRLDCEVVYELGERIAVYLKYGGSFSRDVLQHLTRAGKEVSLALQHLAKLEGERTPEKVRTKIEVD